MRRHPLVQWRRGFTYADHLIFALHLHAFAFLLAAIALVLHSVPGGVTLPIVVLWTLGHAFVALRRTFGRGRLAVAATLAAVVPTYVAVVGVALVGIITLVLVLG